MDRVAIKASIREYYNAEAELRNSKSVRAAWKAKVRAEFSELLLREGKQTLLELGAGAGYDSVYFMESGLSVTAVDISREMICCCRDKGVNAYELDFYELERLNTMFDSVYAMNSLLHVPKSDLSEVLCGIDAVLNKGGLFYMGLYGGDDTENDFVMSEVSDAPRHFVFNSAGYLKKILSARFDIVSFSTLIIGEGADQTPYHSVILRKKA